MVINNDPPPKIDPDSIKLSLPGYIDSKVYELERRTEIQMAAIEKALELQAGKNEVHFAALNNEQARLLADRERFLPRETYAADRKDKLAATMSVVSIILSILFFVVSRLLEN